MQSRRSIPRRIVQTDECPCVAEPNFFGRHGRPRWIFLDRQETIGWVLLLFRCDAHSRCASYRVIATRGDVEIVMYGTTQKRKRAQFS